MGMRQFGRSTYSVIAVLGLLATMLTAASWNHVPESLSSRSLADSTIWVTTDSQGLVHDLDSTVGRAGPPMRAEGGAGADLTTVQAGSNAYLVNNTVGSVRFIDASQRSFGQSWQFEEEGRVSFYADDRIGWAYIGTPTNVLQRVVLGADLEQLGDPIPISADGDDGAVEPSGAIVFPNEQKGTVSRVLPSGQPFDPADPISEPGNDLAVALVDDSPIVIDRTAGEVIVLDDELSATTRCSLGMTGLPSTIDGHGHEGRVAVLSPDQGILVVVDLETCGRESQILGVGDDFGTPLLVEGAAYVPNYTAGTVQIVEIAGAFNADMTTTETRSLGVSPGFELLSENGLVVFNDPTSAVAGVIARDGTVSEHVKFLSGSDGTPTAVAGTEAAERDDDGPGGGPRPESDDDTPEDEPGPSDPGPDRVQPEAEPDPEEPEPAEPEPEEPDPAEPEPEEPDPAEPDPEEPEPAEPDPAEPEPAEPDPEEPDPAGPEAAEPEERDPNPESESPRPNPTPTPTPDPNPNPTPDDPSGPAPGPDPDPEPGPDQPSSPEPVPDEVLLECRSDRATAAVGEVVTYTVTATGQAPVARYVFTVEGQSANSATGILRRSFDRPGNPDVVVRGELTGGGITRTSRCQQVTVGDVEPPPVELGCTSSAGSEAQVDQEVTFFARFPDDVIRWEWEFGDGDLSAERAPVRSFATPGRVPVTLRAEVAGAGRVEASCPLTITAAAPDLVPTFDRDSVRVVVDEPVEFFSTTGNADAVASYAWTFTGADPSAGTTESVPGVTWPEEGFYSVTLVVTNADGVAFSARQTIAVEAAPEETPAPRVAIEPIGNLFTGDVMPLNFRILEGAPTESSWEIWRLDGNGNRSQVATRTGSPSSYTIPGQAGGTYDVILTVRDVDGREAIDTETLSVSQPLNPSFTISPLNGPGAVDLGQELTFAGDAVNPNIDGWAWTFGDGATATGRVATHTFTSPGTVTVTLTVTANGNTARATRTIEVVAVEQDVAVAEVIGLTRTLAAATLTNQGLDPSTQTPVCAAGQPVDTVVSQSPAAGTLVAPDSAVSFEYSDGTDWVMPTLTAQTPSGDYPGLPLTVTREFVIDIDTPAGEVIDQTPPAGEPLCGSRQGTVRISAIGPPPPPPGEDDPLLSCDTSITLGELVTCRVISGPDVGSLTIVWGDGSTDSTPPEVSVTHLYSAANEYTIQLLEDGLEVDRVTVLVDPRLPDPPIPPAPSISCDASVVLGELVACRAIAGPEFGSLTIVWGDGSTDSTPPEVSVTHLYATAGQFTVQLLYEGQVVDSAQVAVTAGPD